VGSLERGGTLNAFLAQNEHLSEAAQLFSEERKEMIATARVHKEVLFFVMNSKNEGDS
jgi:hypothetical protein